MKAISTVIASILMLMIAIALGGTTYLYVSGVFTGKTATTFELIDSVNDTLTIRNSGTEPITSITATLNGNPENIATIPNIPGLVAYWSLNEGSGSKTSDNSANGNRGTLFSGTTECSDPPTTGCPKWVDGKYSKALQFDGSNDYVEADDSNTLDLTSTFTIEGWVKPTSYAIMTFVEKFNACVSGYCGYRIFISPWSFWLEYGNTAGVPVSPAVSGNFITQDRWQHIAVVMSSSDVRFYVDGEQKGQPQPKNGDVQTNADKLHIGWNEYNNERFFRGIVDEVSIFNRALSAEEINQLSSGLVSPGQLATVNPLTSLTKGTHTLKLCTSSMCNTAILTVT